MRRHEINHFLSQFEDVKRLAERVRASIHTESSSDSVARFIRFDGIDDEPLDFKARVFQGRFIARFEIAKQTMQARSFMSGQYAFFQVDGDQEQRLPFSVKLVPTTHILLPDGSDIEMPYGSDEADERYATHQSARVKDAISEAIISHVLENLDTWTFEA